MSTLRGLQVLEVLAGMRQPASLREVSDRCDLSESQTFRVLSALERESFVVHLGRRGYRVASRSVALGTVLGPRPVFHRVVQPVVARLARSVGETVVVHLRSGGQRVLVVHIPSPYTPRRDAGAVLGERSPLPVGASGRVILAHLRREDIHRLGPAAVAMAATERLTRVRELGYEISLGENHPGVNGVSAPLLSEDGDPVGSVTIAGWADRLAPPVLERLARPLLGACRAIGPPVASLLGPDPGQTIASLDL